MKQFLIVLMLLCTTIFGSDQVKSEEMNHMISFDLGFGNHADLYTGAIRGRYDYFLNKYISLHGIGVLGVRGDSGGGLFGSDYTHYDDTGNYAFYGGITGHYAFKYVEIAGGMSCGINLVNSELKESSDDSFMDLAVGEDRITKSYFDWMLQFRLTFKITTHTGIYLFGELGSFTLRDGSDDDRLRASRDEEKLTETGGFGSAGIGLSIKF